MMPLASRLSGNELAIFLFHGVIRESRYEVRNYTRKHLPVEVFTNVIRDLKKHGHPISMDRVVDHVKTGEPFPEYAFAITFDDGFENNYSIAAPILSDMKVPAAFYITTSFVENNAMSWIDRIEYCLETISKGRLKLPWRKGEIPFRATEEKIRLLEEIRKKIKEEPTIEIDSFVENIFVQCGLEPIIENDDPLDSKMKWSQIKDLAADKDFRIGGHSHTHRILSYLSWEELDFEIRTSLEMLKEKAGIASTHYSYPEGLKHCISPDVVTVLKNYKIQCCPTAIDGTNGMDTSLFKLKRIPVT